MEVEEAPGARVSLSLKPILVKLEGGRYIGPIPPASLADLIMQFLRHIGTRA